MVYTAVSLEREAIVLYYVQLSAWRGRLLYCTLYSSQPGEGGHCTVHYTALSLEREAIVLYTVQLSAWRGRLMYFTLYSSLPGEHMSRNVNFAKYLKKR